MEKNKNTNTDGRYNDDGDDDEYPRRSNNVIQTKIMCVQWQKAACCKQ